MKPKVSILIPVYKAEKYISTCIKSVLGQTYQNLEIIIVDDGSPDNSMAIVERLIKQADNRFDIIIQHNEKNEGVAFTRNKLIELAKGDFVQFIDSDDFIAENAIDLLVKIIEETNSDIVRSGHYQYANGQPKAIYLKSWKDKTELLRQYIGAWDSTEGMPFLFIRRSLLKEHQLRFANGINAAEDHLMTLKLIFYANSIADNPTPFYYYQRDNVQSITHVNPKAFHDSMYKGMDNAINFLKENGVYETYREEVLTRTFLTKQTFLLNKENRDIDLYINTHPECNSYYRKFHYNRSQKILFRLAELGQRRLLKLLTRFL